MVINLNNIKSLLEKNMVTYKVKGYQYNDDGPTAEAGENLIPDNELDSWLKSEKIIYESQVDENGSVILDDEGIPIDDITKPKNHLLFDNNTNLRNAIAQTLYDVLTDAASDGTSITNNGVYGGGNKTEGNGNLYLELAEDKLLTLKVGDSYIVVSSGGIIINSTGPVLINGLNVNTHTHDSGPPPD